MPKAKDKGVISGITTNPDDKLIVQKSNPLLNLWRSSLTLAEFKILDIYLSRINSHDPEKRTVIFQRGEIERALGVSRILKSDLRERLRGLYKLVDIDTENGGMKQFPLFMESEAVPDKNGVWRVRLTCSPGAMEYIFNIDHLGYLQYQLRSITALTSRYSYILFLYLEQNRYRKTWEIDLDELKEMLSCDSDKTYTEFKRFNDLVLKKCRRELTEKTGCRFDYETVKSGKKVTAIRFTLETLADILPERERREELPGQIDILSADLDDEYSYPWESEPDNSLYADALPPEFTPEEVEAIRSLAAPIVPHKYNSDVPPECEVVDYLRHKTALMNAVDKGKIKNKFKYLLAMIQKDVDEQTGNA